MGFDAAAVPQRVASWGYRPHVVRRNGSLEAFDPAAVDAHLGRRGYVDVLWLPAEAVTRSI